jgi:PAS domain S-box-containing protein
MSTPLRALLVEDSESDAQLLLRVLRSDGYEPEVMRVETSETMRTALKTREWDIVLCDNSLPQFDALSALRLVIETGSAVPFIIVSGTMEEEQAVAAIKLGAADYLLKDRLGRLGTAVSQALEQSRRRQEIQRAEAALRRGAEEQRELAQKLTAETARLIAAQAVAKVGSWETDVKTGTVSWSEETHRIFETDPAKFHPTHQAFLRLVHPDDRLIVDQAFAASFAVRQTCAIEHRLLVPDGRIKVVEERWQVFADEQGKPLRAVGTCRDITEKKRSDEALRESEEQFRTIVEQAGIGIALVGPTDGRILRCNRALAEMLGYRVEEMTGLTVRDVSDPADYSDDRAQWERMLAGEITRFRMEKKYLRKDGTLTCGRLTSTLVRDSAGRPFRIIGMVEPIDERKVAELLARESEQRLGFALMAAEIGDWNMDLRTNVAYRSLRHDQCFGYAEMVPVWGYDTFLAHVQPADRGRVNACFQRAMAGQGEYDEEFRTAWPDGSIHWLWTKGRFYFDEAGKPIRASGIVIDVTARKRLEASLRESEERFSEAFAHAPIGVALVSPDGQYLKVNRALCDLFGFPEAELLQGTFHDLTAPADLESGRELVRQLFAGEIRTVQTEKRYVHARGHFVSALLNVSLVRDSQGQPRYQIAQIQDISARKRAEAELRASEEQLHALVDRLNTVREEEAKRIARELHDDLGQKLTVLNMELAELERKLPGATTIQLKQIDRMRGVVDHMIEVVQQISGELRLGQLDILGLSAAIDWQVKEFAGRAGIACRIARLDEASHLSDIQRTTVFRIMQEALTNIARHAGATEVVVSLQAGPDELTLTVRDNGRGITAAELSDRKSIGLLGMRERALIVGGEVTLTGGAGVGTTVLVRIPLKGPAA